MDSERSARSVVAGLVALVLVGLTAACMEGPLFALGDEECIVTRVDTLGIIGDSITDADTIKFKRDCEEDHPAVPARVPSDLGG